ncbi:TlpA family protein disulfide reductase [Marinilabiliaceae bacterium JC017]|nr:TlpA family protein disulfide reductase [Marinilabiliaceae bacterium JC017]
MNFSEQWKKYRRKKTKLGIVMDFFFFALLIAMVIPDSRKVVSSTIIRYSMFQPREVEEVIFVEKKDLSFRLEALADGTEIMPVSASGKTIFLNFWATWCPPCIAELPSINKLYELYGDDVAFFFITNEEPETVRSFLEKRGYDLPVYILKDRVPEIFYSRSIPASYLISQKGQIIMKKQGAANWDGSKVKRKLNELLDKN